MVADHFHVVRLLNPVINKARKDITGDRRSNPVRKLLLMNGQRLEYYERRALHQWLDHHPRLKEIYSFKEALHSLYSSRGYNRVRRALIALLDRMAGSTLPEVQKLRKTLMKWKKETIGSALGFAQLTGDCFISLLRKRQCCSRFRSSHWTICCIWIAVFDGKLGEALGRSQFFGKLRIDTGDSIEQGRDVVSLGEADLVKGQIPFQGLFDDLLGVIGAAAPV